MKSDLESKSSKQPKTATFQTYWIIQSEQRTRKWELCSRYMQKKDTKEIKVIKIVWKLVE